MTPSAARHLWADSWQGGQRRIAGRDGADFRFGQTGSDTPYGDTRFDRMQCGPDAGPYLSDFATTGQGAAGALRDTIFGFQAGRDHTGLRQIDANADGGRNHCFAFNGAAPADHAIWALQFRGDIIVRADVNGDARADFELHLAGVASVGACNFFL